MVEGYTISSEFSDMDVSIVHSFLSRSYWSEGITRDTVIRALEHSLCFGVFTVSGNQVGFGRVVTDCATFAYLADVFILEKHRGKGLAKWLLDVIFQHPMLKGLRRIMLATGDAHELYKPLGFKPLAKPGSFMELWKPDIYKENRCNGADPDATHSHLNGGYCETETLSD